MTQNAIEELLQELVTQCRLQLDLNIMWQQHFEAIAESNKHQVSCIKLLAKEITSLRTLMSEQEYRINKIEHFLNDGDKFYIDPPKPPTRE